MVDVRRDKILLTRTLLPVAQKQHMLLLRNYCKSYIQIVLYVYIYIYMYKYRYSSKMEN